MTEGKPSTSRGIDKTLLAVRLVLILVLVPPAYWLVYRVTTTLFSLYGIVWVPHTISLLIAAELAWLIWTRIGWLLSYRRK